jgi:hypothetical protein
VFKPQPQAHVAAHTSQQAGQRTSRTVENSARLSPHAQVPLCSLGSISTTRKCPSASLAMPPTSKCASARLAMPPTRKCASARLALPSQQENALLLVWKSGSPRVVVGCTAWLANVPARRGEAAALQSLFTPLAPNIAGSVSKNCQAPNGTYGSDTKRNEM